MSDETQSRREMGPYSLALVGALAGVAYVVFDMVSEAAIGRGTLRGALAHAHFVVDHALPVVVGALLGVCVHSIRIHGRLRSAEEAASRAEALRHRLQRVERDQAVWVLTAAVLHELNNPLHAIGLLMDELVTTDEDAARTRELVGRAQTQASRALSHLRTLRSMRAVREPELEAIELDRVIASLAGEVRSLASEDGFAVHIECERPVEAKADPNYVRTILENLVDNSLRALRAAPVGTRWNGGAITIELRTENDRAVIRVRDDGAPIDAATVAALFEPLGTAKAQGLGLGLGLPIARALARAMRGDLVFENTGGKAFRLDLPLKTAS
jgi:two-component system NtrC family sensor kinase